MGIFGGFICVTWHIILRYIVDHIVGLGVDQYGYIGPIVGSECVTWTICVSWHIVDVDIV